MAEPDRRPSDFMIMVAVVAASLVIGSVLLVVVPRRAPVQPVAAPSAGPTPTPTSSGHDGRVCGADPDVRARLLAPPENPEVVGAFTTQDTLLETRWPGVEWPLLADELRGAGVQACDYRVWQHFQPPPVGGSGSWSSLVAVTVLRMADEPGTRRVTARLADDLAAMSRGTTEAAGRSDCCAHRDVLVNGEFQLLGIYTAGAYVAVVRVGPVNRDAQRDYFARLADEELQLITG